MVFTQVDSRYRSGLQSGFPSPREALCPARGTQQVSLVFSVQNVDRPKGETICLKDWFVAIVAQDACFQIPIWEGRGWVSAAGCGSRVLPFGVAWLPAPREGAGSRVVPGGGCGAHISSTVPQYCRSSDRRGSESLSRRGFCAGIQRKGAQPTYLCCWHTYNT